MKLWAEKDIKDMPDGYTYVSNTDEALAFIKRCQRMRNRINKKYHDMWTITEICAPIDKVDDYAALFSQDEEKPGVTAI